ncbi:MAG: peroxide stress protein YaaA [Candidatus Marinimicrobia bacterium]|nr:peroxide stress protein YaaA [Candidatus Neomarinimicrobiota bacterium]
MLIILSPSKTQDFSSILNIESSNPLYVDKANYLVRLLKKLSARELSELMSLSQKLSDITYNQFQHFNQNKYNENLKQAIFAYTGEVFNNINPLTFSSKQISFCQSHVRILSGLYGVLKPLDLIQPYRLEMSTNLGTKSENNLLRFWEASITKSLNQNEKEFIINLASKEYLKAIQINELKAQMIHIHFKEKKGDTYKVIGFFAKKARGLMVHFVVKNQIDDPQSLKNFSQDGYKFNSSFSTETDWVFTRN